MDLMVKNARICTMDALGTEIANGFIGIQAGRITELGEMAELGDLTAEQVIDAKGSVVFPGFINTHIHIFQSFLKGLGADHELIEWLNLSALPYGVKMTPHQQYLAAQLATLEAIKTGCTTLAEFFYTNQDQELAFSVIEGMKSSGIRSVFIRTFQDTGEDYGMPKCFIEPASQAIREVEKLRKKYPATADDMLDIWTGPDVTWSTTKQGYEEILEYCLAEKLNYSMHILETEVDNAMCQKNYGQDIVDLLEEIGFLTEKMLAVHCVNLKDKDIRRFAKYGVNISHNPAPNLYLGSGIPPIPESLAAGIPVSIGTDGAASNNTTNFLESMKLAALIQKGYHRKAAIITAPTVVKMATNGGAKALHKPQLGSLETGKFADLIIFNPDQLISTPMHDPYATVVYSAEPANIQTSIINGKVVYDKGVFLNGIDEAALIAEIKVEVAKMLKA